MSAINRRRFVLIAAAAASGGLAGLAGCAGDLRTRPGDSLPSGMATRPSAPTGPTHPSTSRSSASVGPVAAPQSLRSTASLRTPGDNAVARSALAGFGANFLRQAIALKPSANTAISPYSLYTVLAMARAGAKGATGVQLDSVLQAAGTDAQGAVIRAVDAGIAAAIARSEQVGDHSLAMVLQAANQTWVQSGFDVHQEYLDALAAEFGVQAVAADFRADPEKMRSAINAWVAERTRGLISELFPKGSIDDSAFVVLVNALYLKASWAEPLLPAEPSMFTTAAGRQVKTPMMSSSVTGVVGDGWASASIAYLGVQAKMTLLVPDSGHFDDMMARLDGTMMAAATRSGTALRLTMPKFAVSSAPDAKAIAKRLGVTDVFVDQRADLSGIGGPPGYLNASAFVHRAVVKVDEKGTEAAAATGMVMGAFSGQAGPIVQLTVDRPFVFWISETRTGAPLFLGTVTDPTAG
ncbi:MAG: serpin family protein [Actinomycetota bacterium]|nr:serpin family protein [Actinomycetota bacterium]